ncbi:5544_t:CDS:10 [Ambispora gerdemannii]|uniref:5544_t:CDS:1 n=1 Tax=Ambispora gerdemannii TaxID=144530 RepID=A0A9N8VCS1_9GLOM|nr:5544_t:CDS:10 [Ambispora gerdemannii]
MNANAPVFIPQGSSNRINQSSSSSRPQRSSGRTYYPTQTSIQPDVKKSGSKSQNYYVSSQTSARANRRNSSPRKNNHQNNQRSYSSQSGASDESNNNQLQKNEWNVDESSSSPSIHGEGTTVDDTSSMSNLSIRSAEPAATSRNKGKIYLNHLLNFTFPPRQQHSIVSTPRRQKVNYQPYNKERFVNANFRFLINSAGDYTFYQFDPDILLNWQDIEQVIITNPTTPSCPICLQKHTAARVTKCGHTYCLACILHYLELKNDPKKNWRKCPICWDAVYAKDLKSVRFMVVKNLGKIGDGGVPKNNDATITMKLIQRPVSSTVALPRSTWSFTDYSYNTSPPWHFTPNALLFSKLMLASIEYLQGEYQRDFGELEKALLEAKSFNYHEEIPFIELAIQSVKEQLSLLEQRSNLDIVMAEKRAQEIIARFDAKHPSDEIHGEGNHYSSLSYTSENSSNSHEKVTVSNNDNDTETNSTNSQNDAPESPTTRLKSEETSAPDFLPQEFIKEYHISSHLNTTNITQTEDKHSETSEKVDVAASPISISGKSPVLSDGMYYFYQSEDGQRIYLHPLDIRILKHEFEHYENFPNEISVRVIGVEESTMTEELRKRCKYLGHLPLSCDVTFLEVDLNGVVSNITLEFFTNEIQQRKNRRKEKVLQEMRQHEYATLKEQEILNSDPFYQSVYSQLTDDAAAVSGTSPEHETFSSLTDTSSNSLTNSFAPVPGISNHDNTNKSSSDQEYSGPKTVWGTPAISFANVASVVSIGKKQKKKKLILLSNGGLRKR